MARVSIAVLVLVLLALTLPLSAASKDSRADQHKGNTGRPAEPIKQQEAQVPLSVWQSTELALSKAIQTIKEQAVATEKQAEADQETWCSPSVKVNIALAIIGFGYLVFAGLQWNEISEQARIANKMLLLQFRPKLIIRNVVIDVADEIPRPPLFRDHHPVSGQFYISNTGGTEAKITEIGCWVEWSQILPMQRPYEGKHGFECSATALQPSQSIPWTFNSANDGKLMNARANDILSGMGNWALYVMGWVQYIDDLKTPRRTAFCRKYEFSKGRFLAVDDPDYEHQE